MTKFTASSSLASGALMGFVTRGMVVDHFVNEAFSQWQYAIKSSTFFIKTYLRSDIKPLTSTGSVNFEISRSADVLSDLYLLIDLPAIHGVEVEEASGCGLSGCGIVVSDVSDPFGDDLHHADSKNECTEVKSGGAEGTEAKEDSTGTTIAPATPWACYVPDIGYALFEYITFTSGTAEIDKLYSQFAYIYKELTGSSDRNIDRMTGSFSHISEAIDAAASTQLLYVPLAFWFTGLSGNAFPLIACQYTRLYLKVTHKSVDQLIIRSAPNVEPYLCGTNRVIKEDDIRIGIEQGVVFLDNKERATIMNQIMDKKTDPTSFTTTDYAKKSQDVKMSRVMATGIPIGDHTVTVQNNGFGQSNLSMSSTPNGSVLCTMVVCRRVQAIQNGSYFDYSGVHGRDPLKEISFYLNNSLNIKRESKFFRTVTCMKDWNKIPDQHIYVHNWSANPSNINGAGSSAYNFDKTDNFKVQVYFQEELANEEVRVEVYNFTYNILKFYSGVVSKLYALS